MSWRLPVWISMSLLLHGSVAGATYGVLRAAQPAALFVDLTLAPPAAETPVVPDSLPRRDVAPAPKGPRAPSRTVRDRVRASPEPTPAPLAAEPTPAPATPPPATPPPPPSVAAPPMPAASPPATPPPVAAPTEASPPPSAALDLVPNTGSPVVEAEPRATTSGSAQSAAPSAAGATGAWTGDRTVGTGPAARGSDAAGAAASQGPRDGTQAALAVPGGRGAGDGAEYAGYYDLLRRRVLDTLKYPTLARRRGLTGTVQVELEIQPTGAISKVEIVASSSHRVLDDAAVEAVHRLGRLPVPAHLPPRLLRVRLPVVFELQ